MLPSVPALRVIVWLALLATLSTTACQVRLERRNLVLITVDTLRKDSLGIYGGDLLTPGFDALAAESFRFEDAYSTAPTTLPSHASLFTGTYPHRHGVRRNGRQRVPDELQTLAETLYEAGYRTGAFVGTAVLDSFYGLDQGFEVYGDNVDASLGGAQAQRRAPGVVDEALEWMLGVEEPFFLWVHVFDPHGPYEPPAPWDQAYYSGDPRSPAHGSLANLPLVYYQNLEGITDIEYPRAQYRGEVSFTDQSVTRLLSAIQDQADRTLVVLTSDHGESLGEDGSYFDHGGTLHDVCMRVPLLVRAPWLGGGEVVHGPVSLIDIFPTVVELLGLPAEAAVEGRSLLPHLQGTPDPDRLVFFETFLSTGLRRRPLFGVRSHEWKVTRVGERTSLLHPESDPAETENRSSVDTEELVELLKALDEYEKQAPRFVERIEPSTEQEERLRALGYLREDAGVPPRKSNH